MSITLPGARARATTTARVRVATVDDAPALAALRYEFRIAQAPAVECEKKFGERCTAWMRERLDDATSAWRCWVAQTDDGLIATLWLQLVEKIPNPVAEPERHAYITSVYVRPGYRNRGLGTELVQSALTWAEAQDVDAVFLWRTDASESLYRRHGFDTPPLLIERRRRDDSVG